MEDRIGGDSDLTEKGRAQARALADYFKKKRIPLIFTSQKKRTQQTASPIKEAQEDCTIIPLAEFDEINSGICECMSYKKIRTQMPQVYAERQKDKYNYVYPEGEGYATMQERINRGIKKSPVPEQSLGQHYDCWPQGCEPYDPFTLYVSQRRGRSLYLHSPR